MKEKVWLDGFKVLAKDRGRYYSCALEIGTRQEYGVNKRTKRRKGKWGALAVFKTLETARAFEETQRPYYDMEIFSCQWLPSPSDVKGLYMPAPQWTRRIKNGRKLNPHETRTSDGRVKLRDHRIPTGTMLAEEVTILERV